jgi:hypothetical protein
MNTFGGLLLTLRQKYGHGLDTAYYRDIVRPQILKTAPIDETLDPCCEVHVLTCAKDWLNLIWCLKSLYYYTQRRYALCIHEDGSLTPEIQDILKYHFPQARLVNRAEADIVMAEVLAPYPRCLQFRQTNHLALKVFDFAAYLQSERMLLFDSDILFFREPIEFLNCLEDPHYQRNIFNGDVRTAYTLDLDVLEQQLDFKVQPRVNSGLALIHRSSMRFDWIESFLALPNIVGHFWRIEQTLYALCSSRFGVELLPACYDVHREKKADRDPCRHYVGRIRHLMYSEGIRSLIQQKFLASIA